MPRKCTICEHEQVEEINKEIVKGIPLRDIANQFNVNHSTIYRHKDHIPQQLTKAKEAQDIAQADNLLFQVEQLNEKAWELLSKAENSGQLKTALQGIREAKGCLELLAKLQGELQQEGTVNITLAPEWMELRQIILQELEPYPEARFKLAEKIEEVEKNAGN